jgi:HAMP domain-containing protein
VNSPKKAAGNPKKYFRIRDKILIAFLAVSLVAVGIISVFALQNMSMVGNTARANSIKLGETAVAESVAALEESGRKIIQLKAQVVAKDFQIFLENNAGQPEEELLKSDFIRNIAIQLIGQTGYTMIYGYDNLIYLDVNPKLIGTNIDDLSRDTPQFHDILRNGFKMESAGYYNQEDAHGNIRVKYAYCVPIMGTKYVVVATTYIDEFSRPAAETESRITSQVQAITRYIDNQLDLAQWTFFFIIAAMLVLISILTTYVARSITNPIVALTRSVDIIAKGDLTHRIKVQTGDEVEQLADGFNTMTAALKESYATLEQKVKERTKELSQRAGQLHTINEISRKISSVINLDELLPLVTNLVKETFSYDNVNIFLFENSSGKMIIKEICLSGYNKVIPLDVPLELGEEGIVAWVAQTGEALLANDVTKEPKYQFVEELSDTKSELVVPVKIGDIGCSGHRK